LIIADVNALIYAFRSDSRFHKLSRGLVMHARSNGDLCVLPEVASSFVRIVTDQRITTSPDTTADAVAFIDALTATGRLMREPRVSRWAGFRELTTLVDIRGNLVPDALLAATCIDFGASILTADRDFLTFPGLRVHLITSAGVVDFIPG